VREQVHNLAGEISLGALFALIDQALCVITNDTGPMHVAWALATPSVCLFGPGDPNHYGWDGADVEILYKRLYCSPCLYEVDVPPCQGNNVCMQRISVDEVMEAVDRILRGASLRPTRLIDPDFFSDHDARPLGRVLRGSLSHEHQRPHVPVSRLRSGQGSPATLRRPQGLPPETLPGL
jgi:hypothetical protein